MSEYLPIRLIEALERNEYIPVVGWGYPDFAPRPSFVSYPYGSLIDYLRPEARSWMMTAGPAVWPLFQAAAQLPVKKIITLTPDRLLKEYLSYYRDWVTLSRDQIEYPRDQPILFPVGGDYQHPQEWLLENSQYLKYEQTNKRLFDRLLIASSGSPLLVLGCDLSQRVVLNFLTRLKDPPQNESRGWVVCDQAAEGDIFFWEQAGFEVIQGPPSRMLVEIVRYANDAVTTRSSGAVQDHLNQEPYKYLDFFDRKDGDIFFGRNKDKQGLIDKISAHRLAIVAGPSGSGKTSLINAGLLAWTDATDSKHIGVYARCGQYPVNSIREALAETLGEPEMVNSELSTLVKLVRDRTNKLPLIVLDQAEELFTQAGGKLRDEFFQQLRNYILATPLDVRFVISLRDDFLGRLSQMTHVLPIILQDIFYLGELTEEQAIEAILGPAKACGLLFDEQLATTIVREFDAQKIPPPQIQVVVSLLYEARIDNRIDLTTYESLGGTQTILRGHLSRELEKSTEMQQETREILKAMVTSEGTKDIVTLGELSKRSGVEADIVYQIIHQLRDKSRLVRSIYQDKAIRFELAHEYLTGEIWTWMAEKEIKKREVEELLARELRDWGEFRHLRLGKDRLELFEEHQDKLELDEAAISYLLLSSIKNRRSVSPWASRLENLGPEVSDRVGQLLFSYFWDKDVWQRREAAETIAKLDPAVIMKVLLAESADHRMAALDMVGGIGIKKAIPRVISMLKDPDRRIPELACAVLGELGGKAAVDALIRVALHSDEGLYTVAIQALCKAYLPKALSCIEAAFLSDIPVARRMTEEILIKSRNVWLIEDLLRDEKIGSSDRDRLWEVVKESPGVVKHAIANFVDRLPPNDIQKAISILERVTIPDHLLNLWLEKEGPLREFAEKELLKQKREDDERKEAYASAEHLLDSGDPAENLREYFTEYDGEEDWAMIMLLTDKIDDGIIDEEAVLQLMHDFDTNVRKYVLYAIQLSELAGANLESLLKELFLESDPTILYLVCMIAADRGYYEFIESIAKLLDNEGSPRWYYEDFGEQVKDAAAHALDILRPDSQVWRKDFQRRFK